MSELENKTQPLGATDLLALTQTLNTLVDQHEEAKNTAWRLRMPNTTYADGDKVIVPGVGNFDKILRCESAGTTAETAFPGDYNALAIGDVVQDGTVAWGVVNLVTIPDIEDSPVTSVNGKTGDVVLTAQGVGALPLAGGTMTGAIVSNSDITIHSQADTGRQVIAGGSTLDGGARLSLRGRDASALPGNFYLTAVASDGSAVDLNGAPDGTLTWDEKNIVRSINGEKADKSGNIEVQFMQTDCSNASRATLTAINTMMPNAVDYVVESWKDENGGWYRLWRSGWLEQGGLATSTTTPTEVTLYREYAEIDYHVVAGMNMGNGKEMPQTPATATPYTTHSIRVGAYSGNDYTKRIAWTAVGYAKE